MMQMTEQITALQRVVTALTQKRRLEEILSGGPKAPAIHYNDDSDDEDDECTAPRPPPTPRREVRQTAPSPPRCIHCNGLGNHEQTCALMRASAPPRRLPQCIRCGRKGHQEWECRRRSDPSEWPSRPRCEVCGKNNHLAWDCWWKPQSRQVRTVTPPTDRCKRCHGLKAHA
jgi:hypothetical protein